jgi:hypothetical protein
MLSVRPFYAPVLRAPAAERGAGVVFVSTQNGFAP